jgi:hypothetical protein
VLQWPIARAYGGRGWVRGKKDGCQGVSVSWKVFAQFRLFEPFQDATETPPLFFNTAVQDVRIGDER